VEKSGHLPDAVGVGLAAVILRFTPPGALAFVQLARLDRPIGWWLLLLPCWWSSALAAAVQHRFPNLLHLALFMIGAIAMRGAGSTYNDIIDRDLDAKVERTAGRPLPSGRISVASAKAFLLVQSLIGLCVLLSFNGFAIGLGFVSLLIVVVYPFMKRLTSWPQAVLGLAFAWGGLIGWAAAFATLSWPAVWLYLSAVLWTIGYDTIYALQDARDDAIVGIRSTARLFKHHVAGAVGALYAGCFVLAATALWVSASGPWAFLGLLGFGLHLAWQVRHIPGHDTRLALTLFRSNREAGLILFTGLALQACVNGVYS
jgi:4-hydroxybenzoate polyprenyltransferase